MNLPCHNCPNQHICKKERLACRDFYTYIELGIMLNENRVPKEKYYKCAVLGVRIGKSEEQKKEYLKGYRIKNKERLKEYKKDYRQKQRELKQCHT